MVDNNEATALHYAVLGGEQTIKLLLSAEPDLIYISDKNNSSKSLLIY